VTNVTEVADLGARAVALLIQQFKSKVDIEAMVSVYADEMQEVQTTLFDMLEERALDTAVGVQLDIIGKLVKLDRLARTDAEYRKALRVEIAVIHSRSLDSDLFGIIFLLTGATVMQLYELPPAGISFYVDTVGTATAAQIESALDRAAGAAIKLEAFTTTEGATPFGFFGDDTAEGFSDTGVESSGVGTLADNVI